MDQNYKDTILDNLTKAENILIVVSKTLGYDGLAAGLALYLSLIKLDKNVSIVAKAPTVGDAQSLYGVDKIGRAESVRNPVVVIDNAVETVDKITYFLDKTKLKVVIHRLRGTQEITQDQISVEYTSAPASIIFAIGVDNLYDLRSEFTHEQEISPEAWILNISNLEPSQKFAQIDVVNTQAAGVSEVMARMLQDLALPVDEDIAYNLYSGVRASTNNFSPNLVSPISFEIASWLMKFGAGKTSLARRAKEPFLPPDISQDFFEKTTAVPKSTDWLKPPKIYKGSKSVSGENKG